MIFGKDMSVELVLSVAVKNKYHKENVPLADEYRCNPRFAQHT